MEHLPSASLPPECLRCGTLTKPGFMLDHTYGGIAHAAWCPGAPVKGWLTGIKIQRPQSLMRATTFRCPTCGRLESFAFPEPPAQ